MATSQSSNIKEERRSAPFYSKYEYKISFDLTGAGRTYYCDDIYDLDTRMANNGENYATKNMDRTALAMFINWRAAHQPRYASRGTRNARVLITIVSDAVRVYSADLDILKEIKNLGFTNISIVKAVVDIPTGVMEFVREPKHKYRSYFKAKRVTEEFRQNLSDTLNQYDDLFPCDALTKWLKLSSTRWSTRWLSCSFFVDYDNESMKSIMMLLWGNQYIGKHYELVKRK